DRNLISGNNFTGISVMTAGVTGNVIQGNYIGTDDTGNNPLGNSNAGVRLGVAGTTVGGTAAGAGNRIAFNAGDAVGMTNTSGTGNAVPGHEIFATGGLGIDLNGDGVSSNDPLDFDSGANGLQNFPVLTAVSADAAGTNVRGIFNGKPSATFRLEFFASGSADPSGFGE